MIAQLGKAGPDAGKKDAARCAVAEATASSNLWRHPDGGYAAHVD